MCCSSRWLRVMIRILMLLSASLFAASSQAQNIGGNQGGGGAGGGNQAGGILIDAEGVVHSLQSEKVSAQLHKERRDAFVSENLNDDLTLFSERRCVSLVRLEQACAKAISRGEPLDEDLRHFAGLQQIDFLFVDPDGADLILAGPAEGFAPDASNRMVGLTTGRPPIRIDDFMVALQAMATGSTSIGCSIDPEPARLANVQRFVQQNNSATSQREAKERYRQMRNLLGLQNVSVFGVPPDSHFALSLVEADFRMKRISLGVDASGVRGLRSHLSLLKPNGNSIQRWWFTALYDGLTTTEDRTAYHLTGQRVQLLAQDEIAFENGQRSNAAFTRASTQQFAKMFTEQFPELAARSPLFAELQNLFDLAVIAALLQHEQLPQQIGWDMPIFLEPDSELILRYAVPQHVESASTTRSFRRGLVLGLIGGVTIKPRPLLQNLHNSDDPAIRLESQQQTIIDRRPEEPVRWWWD